MKIASDSYMLHRPRNNELWAWRSLHRLHYLNTQSYPNLNPNSLFLRPITSSRWRLLSLCDGAKPRPIKI